MGTITGLTAERMLEIEAASIVDGEIVGNNLILTKQDTTTIDAGQVKVGLHAVVADLANISGVAGSAVGDYFLNAHDVNHTILGLVTAPGGLVKSTSATAGTAAGNIRGAGNGNPRIMAKPAAVTSYTFSGLDGNADGPFKISIAGSVSGAGVTPNYASLEVNGITTPTYARTNSASWAGSTDAAQAAQIGRSSVVNMGVGESNPYGLANIGSFMVDGILDTKPFGTGVGIHYSGRFAWRAQNGNNHSVHGLAQSFIEHAGITNITSVKILFGRTFSGVVTLEKMGAS